MRGLALADVATVIKAPFFDDVAGWFPLALKFPLTQSHRLPLPNRILPAIKHIQ